MVYGPIQDWLAEEAEAGSLSAKKAFDARPDIGPDLHFVWIAFSELTSDRQATTAGVGPIPFSAIDCYARRVGLNQPEQFARFLTLIRRLDNAYLVAMSKKAGNGS